MNAPALQPAKRILSIDILRGAVMLIMAIDHVRDYFHVHGWDQNPTDMATTTPFLFFTRWITHFCAPVFVFLSGTSAFIAGQKKSKKELSIFLIKRGFWLVLVEVVIMTLGITFNPLYNVIIWQVIWAIGWSMIILGLLVRTSVTTIAVIGFIIVFGHNILDYTPQPAPETTADFFMRVFLTAQFTIYHTGENRIILDIYAILPWTGAMLLGYAFGTLYKKTFDAAKRRKIILQMGLAVTALFIILRFINQYGDPAHWSQQKNGVYTFLSFLNTTKYPCSLLYLCMTLGPALIILSLIENAQSKFSRILITYGRVPFFYYVIHFYLIHGLCVIFFFASGYTASEIIDRNTPFLFRPEHFGFDLWVVYAVWLFVIIILYKPCKWFQRYKETHNQWWLSYV